MTAQGEMATGPTCGQGLAENATLPGRITQLIASMADILVIHMGALDLSDESAQREHVAYRELAEALRDASVDLARIAVRMGGYRDLPMGRHDPAPSSRAAARARPRDADGDERGRRRPLTSGSRPIRRKTDRADAVSA